MSTKIIKKIRLRIAYTNVGGLNGKLCSLRLIIQEDPDILALCETHMNTDKNISINGYRFISRCCKNTSGGGGIGLLVKEEIIQHIT